MELICRQKDLALWIELKDTNTALLLIKDNIDLIRKFMTICNVAY